MYKSKTPKHKYRFIKPSLKARLENCTKAIAKVNSDHLAESISLTSHCMSEELAGGLGLYVHDGEHSQPLFPTVTPAHTVTW